jgi:hypothetical protein
MLTFPQRLTKLISRIPGYIYLWLAMPIFGSSSALTRKITEIGAQHSVGGHNPISYWISGWVGGINGCIGSDLFIHCDDRHQKVSG